MKGNRGRNTHLELRLRAGLAAEGIRGYRCNFKVEGTRVDLAFERQKLAVMVQGCFWHSCPVCKLDIPKSHGDYWSRKFAINKRRDRLVRNKLELAGWQVLEVWGHEVEEDLGAVVQKIENIL